MKKSSDEVSSDNSRTEEAKEETQTEARESKRIKQEVVTPAKSLTQGRSRLEVSPKPDADVQVTRQPKPNPSPEPKQESVAKGRGRRSPSPAAVKTAPRARSRSPSPSPSRRSARGKNVSPAREVIKDEDVLPSNPVSGKGRKSVSPKPAKSQRVKDELFEELDDDFDMSVKTPTRSRISGRKSQHSHVLNEEDVEVQSGSCKTFKKVKKEQESEVSKVMPKTSPPSKTNKRVLLDDSDEDDLGRWQGRRQGQKQTSRGDDSDDLMDILSSKHKKHKANTSGTRVSDEDNLFDDIPSSRTNAAQSEAARQGKVAKHDGRGARQKSHSPSPTRRVKRDVKEDSEEDTMTEQTTVKKMSRRQNRDARARVDVLEVPEEEPVTAAEVGVFNFT